MSRVWWGLFLEQGVRCGLWGGIYRYSSVVQTQSSSSRIEPLEFEWCDADLVSIVLQELRKARFLWKWNFTIQPQSGEGDPHCRKVGDQLVPEKRENLLSAELKSRSWVCFTCSVAIELVQATSWTSVSAPTTGRRLAYRITEHFEKYTQQLHSK